jgi:hypothetical protein
MDARSCTVLDEASDPGFARASINLVDRRWLA